MLRFLLLLSGVFFCSTSVILIRSSSLAPALVGSYRLLFASILLLPIFLKSWHTHRNKVQPRLFLRCLIPSILLAAHLMSWAAGARMTYIANATLIINLTPAVMPLLAFFLIKEKVTRREILGTAVALVGVAILSANAFSINPDYLMGNFVCFASMITFAAYLAFGRINKDFPSIWLYMVPIYIIASVVCFLFSVATLDSVWIGSWEEARWMLAMAILPTILGHVTLNNSLRYFTAQTFAVVNLHQFVSAGILGWLIFSDSPPKTFYFAAALCVSGAVIVIHEAAKIRRAERAKQANG
ncbi:DMT family transporter [Pelagicoccus sp. SDUM812002]|uniref:DMT family transporter n=1 Tax=Pelagicoccus sp. SDUM812002 TaxID=3041266 RepID=UPI00280D80AA|nr:DMT family transporter [Pelagicoccus sp. SDUM812002]MDQ8187961.1 DMT family transporter [Pelagicoccus sp. SDUM812002]